MVNFDFVKFGNPNNTGVKLDFVPDDEYKLGLEPAPIIKNSFLIRVNPNQLYFPIFPDRRGTANMEEFKKIIDALSRFLNLEIDYKKNDLERYLYYYNLQSSMMEEQGNFLLRERRIGNYIIWDVLEKDLASKFPFFQIFSKDRDFNDFIGKKLLIRIDSGCQIGQVYDDGGCDCRSQFLRAIENGFLVFHLPIQDGRGWGMVTKMKTEELKRGGLDTISAAREFFNGDSYDIRDYGIIGKFLRELLINLGIEGVILNTDNRRKLEALKNSGIEVERFPTQTLGFCIDENNERLAKHIRAKHATNDYFG